MDEKHTAYPVAGSLTEQERHSIEAFYRAFSDKSPDLLNEAVVPDWQDIPLGHSGLSPDKDLEYVSHQGLDRRRLTRVREYIAANLEGDLTIAQLAKVACLSRFHFARAFKAAVGQSPHQYVSARRLEHAKEMLMRGDQPLLDIAIALNFSSQANFTRAFRVGTGMTPGRFRRDFARR